MRLLALLALLPSLALAQGVRLTSPDPLAAELSLAARCNLEASLDCYPRDAVITRASSTWCEQSDGQYAVAASGNACFGKYGLFVAAARTNISAYDSIDGTTWGGAGVVTAASVAGPFDTIAGGNSGNTCEDDNVAVAEYCTHSLDNTVLPDADITCSIWAKEGTSSAATLRVSCGGGTGTGNCSTDTLTSSWQRLECTKTCSGGTSRQCIVYPHNGAGTSTGTVYLTGGQLEASSYATPNCLSTGSAVTCDTDNVSLASTGLPQERGLVKYEVTPFYTDQPAAGYMVDCVATNGWGTYISGSEELGLVTDSGATADSALGALPTHTAGTTIRVSASWGGVVSIGEADGKKVAVSGTAEIPGALPNTCYLGSNNGSTLVNTGWLRRLEVYR